MNNELNNNKPSNDSLLNETSEAVTTDTIKNEQSTIKNEDAKVTEEKVDKKEKDLSLPTTMEDYIKLSKNFYAGFWVRFVAYLIDMIVIYAIAYVYLFYSDDLLLFSNFR